MSNRHTDSTPGMTVALAGATGYIGRAVASALLARGHRVVALVRSETARDRTAEALGLPGCELRVVSTDPTHTLADAAPRAVISCMASRSGEPDDAWRVDHRANADLLNAAVNTGVRHFTLLSAICVQRPMLAFQHAKLAFEAQLQAADIDWSIVRPTAFFKSLSGQVERVRAGKPFLVFGDGELTACKPLAESDLAHYLASTLHDPALAGRILPIGGPGPAITPLDQAAMLSDLLERPVRVRHVPPGMFTAALGVLGPLGRVIPALRAKAELARIGRYYATESMLLWDDARGRYDADATPVTGTQTLRDHYQRVLAEGLAGQELGDHKLF